jgi:Domain of unknown function (DUF4249)
MKQIITITMMSILFTACEKEINIDLNSSNPQIIIEGVITNQPGPYFVKITKTVNFSGGNNYPLVSNAIVIVSDNLGNAETLTEISPGIYQINTIAGIPGRTYNLSVSAEGKTYNAISTMPYPINLDTLKFIPFSGPGSGDNYSTIPIFADPSIAGNNYRFLLTVNGILDESYIVFNDNATNGTVNQRPIFSPETEVKLGDSVKVEMRCIDVNTYTYFYTLSQITGGGLGGGTTPSNPPNNITGDKALGYFSAHTTQSRIQIVQ